MLEITELETGYGKKQVLFGLSLEIRAGEVIALIGPNGAGKSTVLKAVCGLISVWKGEIRFNGSPTQGASPAQNVARGITFAPQGSRVFADLTVMENLRIGGFQLPRKEAMERIAQVLPLFPVLKERLRQDAGRLSGGEQQMLALARALVSKPKLLLLDEPCLGLAPNLVGTVFKKISRLNEDLAVTILIVEQKVREVLKICDRVYSMKLGRIAFVGIPEDLKGDKAKLKELFL
ncbi:MAG: ABC transporter ATP-binding protein [Planctomycetota bacterium]|nr:ABC transporter ATP-binding protein [Planctomycetota bacterium]